MSSTASHSLHCRPLILGAVVTRRGTALALCGALMAVCSSAVKAGPEPLSTADSKVLAPERVAPANLPLELRGIVLDESGPLFGFYNLKNGRSTWVALGKPMDGFVVRSHDEGSDWITAEFEGHVFTMALKKAPLGGPGLIAPPPTLAKANEANRSEILNRKVLRLRTQKARLQKVIKDNAYAVPEEAAKE